MIYIKKYQKIFFWIVVILYSNVFFIDFLATHFSQLHFGKDNGLIFRIVATCLVSAIFFGVIKKRKVIGFLIGFFMGLFSYILTFIIYLITSIAVKGDNSGWDIRLIFDQLIATTIICICGMFVISVTCKLSPGSYKKE